METRLAELVAQLVEQGQGGAGGQGDVYLDGRKVGEITGGHAQHRTADLDRFGGGTDWGF